jgi:hypothetical protein
MTKQDLIQRLSDNHLIHRKRVKRQSEESANITNPIASRTCFQRSSSCERAKEYQPSHQIQSSSRISIMGFVNEVVSDEDIERYGLPFKKGSGRYWTRDAERNYYLWGGIGGNTALGEQVLGRFSLFCNGILFKINVIPGIGSRKLNETPYVVTWDSIQSIQQDRTDDCNEIGTSWIINILKEALECYGEDGEENRHVRKLLIKFGF